MKCGGFCRTRAATPQRCGVRAGGFGGFFMWPVLKLRLEDGKYTLLVIEKTFTGTDPNRVARDAVAHFVTFMRQMLDSLPASWLRECHPKAVTKMTGRVGLHSTVDFWSASPGSRPQPEQGE